VLIGFLINPFQIDSQTFALQWALRSYPQSGNWTSRIFAHAQIGQLVLPRLSGQFSEWTFVIIPNTTSARDSTSKAKATKADFWMWGLAGIVRPHRDAKSA
jgi:hypothetical protein